eukprot:3446080-Pyramimonas_sp.AAC.1
MGSCKCETSAGPKGIPMCKVESRPHDDNIDLLPLTWLWSRGCKYSMEDSGPTLTTPKGTNLH